jgi:hypothetical protein
MEMQIQRLENEFDKKYQKRLFVGFFEYAFMTYNVSPYDRRCQFYELTLFRTFPSNHKKRKEVDLIVNKIYNKMRKLDFNRYFIVTSIKCLDYSGRYSVKIECTIDRRVWGYMLSLSDRQDQFLITEDFIKEAISKIGK